MLQIELEMQRISVVCRTSADGHTAELILLDLDSATPPDVTAYRQMIGFTQGATPAEEGVGRRCLLILHRPFEMSVMRQEVEKLLDPAPQGRAVPCKTAVILDSDGVILGDGRRVSLSPKERMVLELLLCHSSSPVSRKMISETIGESSANKADVYVCLLRKKLEPPTQRLIKTVRGKGYQLI